MSIENFLQQLEQQPDSVEFEQTMDIIGRHFHYQPSRFNNGPELVNETGSNEGSCKIFSLGKQLGFNEAKTLACFGRFYRDDVLQQPAADNHANIRAFMQHGWAGIDFEHTVLTPIANKEDRI